MAVTDNFSSSVLDLNSEIGLQQPTALVWGPDGRLYITEVDGDVKVITVAFGDKDPNDANPAGQFYVTDAVETSLVKNIQNYNDDGTANSSSQRQVTGIDVTKQFNENGEQLFVAPDGSLTTDSNGGANPSAVTMYVTSSDSRIGAGGSGADIGLDTNSGVVTKLTQTGKDSWEAVDIVRGLPRSEENHATNGLEAIQELDSNGNLISERLIVASGGNANTGAPSNNFAGQQEQPLSGAILEIDLDAIKALPISTDGNGRQYVIDLPTLDDPTRANANGITDISDPNYTGVDSGVDYAGGNDGLNSAKLQYGDVVTIYSSGYRNPYDVEVTEDGRVWTYDNGANNSWGGRPVGEAGDNGGSTDFPQTADYIATNLNNGDGNSNDDINIVEWNPSNNDQFHEVTRSDDLDGRSLSVGGFGAVTTYIGPDGETYVYGGHPNPTRAEGALAGLLFAPDAGTDNAYLLVSTENSYGTDGGRNPNNLSDYERVIAFLSNVEADDAAYPDSGIYGVETDDLTKKVLAVEPGVLYDIYSFADGSGTAVVAGSSAPVGGTFQGQSGLPADIAEIVDFRNPIEGDYKEAGKTDGALDSGKGSINGLAEYTSTVLDDGTTKMSGAILATVLNSGTIIVMGREADGTVSSVANSSGAKAADRETISVAGGPLGIATIGDDYLERGLSQAFQGSIWTAVFSGSGVGIEILQPNNGAVPLAGSEISDVNDADLDGVDKFNDPFEFSADNGYAIDPGEKITLDFNPTGTEFPDTISSTGLLGAALDGPGSAAGSLFQAGVPFHQGGVTANQDAQTGQYLTDAGDSLPADSQEDGLFDLAGNIIPGGNAPILQIKKVVPGTMVGAANTVRDALHTGIRPAADVGRLLMTVTAKNWIAGNTVSTGQLTGLVFGDGTQSNFLRLVFGEVNGAPGIEVGYEINDANYTTLAQLSLPKLTDIENDLIDLRLEIDKANGFAVKAFYRLADASTITNTTFTEISLDAGNGFSLPVGVLQDVLTGAHTITDGDTTLVSGAAVGVVAETSEDSPLAAIDFPQIEVEAFGNEIIATTATEVGQSGTTGEDTVIYVGTDITLAPLAANVENFDGSGSSVDWSFTGNALDNTIILGAGANFVTTGDGIDKVIATLSTVDNTEISDFSEDDEVIITDASTASTTVAYGSGSAVLTLNGSTITFSGPDFDAFDPQTGSQVFSLVDTAEGLSITRTPAETLIAAVNAGTNSYTYVIDGESVTFEADSGGAAAGFLTTGSAGGGGSKLYDGTPAILEAQNYGVGALSELHWTERSSPQKYFGYEIPNLENGTYRVDLYFAEIYHGVTGSSWGNDQRVFDILIEQNLVADNFDLFDIYPDAPATEIKQSYEFEISDGGFTLDFDARAAVGGIDQPKISGFALYKIGNTFTPIDTAAPQIASITVSNEQGFVDGTRDLTVVLTDDTGFDLSTLAQLSPIFTDIVPENISVPVITLSSDSKTATLVYTLDPPVGGAWPNNAEGQVFLASGAFEDAAGNGSFAITTTFTINPFLDSTLPTVTLTGDTTASEGGTASYTIELDQVPEIDVTVAVELSAGVIDTASLPADAELTAGGTQALLAFAAGTTDLTQTFTVDIFDDTLPELDEVFTVAISSAEAIATASVLTTIVANDGPVDSFNGINAPGGDFSGDGLVPTDIGVLALQPGSNTLIATQQGDDAPGGRDRDYVTFEVPVNTELSQILLKNYLPGESAFPQGFIGIDDGAVITLDPTLSPSGGSVDLLGGYVYNTGDIDSDILDDLGTGSTQGIAFDGFTAPLPAGTYTLWMNQGGPLSQIELEFVVTDAPGEPTNQTVLYRVNVGGAEIAATTDDPVQLSWAANTDSGAQSGDGFSNNTGKTFAPSIAVTGADASLPAYVPYQVFGSERYDVSSGPDMLWNFDVTAGGTYQVNLFFRNGFDGTNDPGERIFDVLIEGTEYLSNVDLSDTFGHQVAGMLSQTLVVEDSTLDIEFLHDVENPLINAIEIIRLDGEVIPVLPKVSILNTEQTVSEGVSGGQVQISVATDISVPVDETVDITFQIKPIGATPGTNGDYEYVSASATLDEGTYIDTVSIAGGTSSVIIPINILDDLALENSEAFQLTLVSVSTNAQIDSNNSAATVTIADNDFAKEVSIATAQNAAEPATNGQFSVSLSEAATTDTTVSYTVTGTATPDSDYTALTGSVTIPGGSLTALIDVLVIDDVAVEGSEDVTVTLDAVTAGDADIVVGAANTATVAIADDESVGAATLSVNLTSNNIQISNFGNNSFLFTNTGDKDITQLEIDVTNALYPDSVFDPEGVAGDTAAKGLQINTNGSTGVESPSSDSYIGVGGTAGYEGLKLTFDPTINSGFNPGEQVGFSIDMDPNSIAGAQKSTLDEGTDPYKWDVGGVSGAELIGSTFTVTFADGTTATGQLQGVGNNGGSQGLASQNSPNLNVSLAVNGLSGGGVGTYGADNLPNVIVNGPAGETARVILTKGFIQPVINLFSEPYKTQLDDQLAALLATNFPANNAVEFQTVDILLTGEDQDISNLFDFADVTAYDFVKDTDEATWSFDEDKVPLGFVASIIDPANSDLPKGAVTNPIYLEYMEVPTVSIVTTQNGDEAGPVDGTFTVNLNQALATDTVVSYTVSGTATPDVDYTQLSGSATIVAGQTSALIPVAVLSDTDLEGAESVVVTLDAITSGEPDIIVGTEIQATVAIADDVNEVSITATQDAAEPSTDGQFTVSLTQAAATDTTIAYSVSGTATPTGDYTALTGSVMIPAGSLSASIDVAVIEDAEAEGSEDVIVTLETVTAGDGDVFVSTTSNTATVNIADDDLASQVLYRVNAGGADVAAVDGGIAWSADTEAQHSDYLLNPGSNDTGSFKVQIDPAMDPLIAATTPGGIFQTERYDKSGGSSMQWAFAVPEAGNYEVRLFMGNGWSGTNESGERVFDVAIEGLILSNLNDIDLSAQFGHEVGGVITNQINVIDGELNIEFLHQVENPLINGIEILQV